MREHHPCSEHSALKPALLLLFLCSCALAPVTVEVIPVKDALAVTPKASNCSIEFFEIQTLDRPYEKLAELRVPASNAYPNESMRAQACALGADAIIGLHKLVGAIEVSSIAHDHGDAQSEESNVFSYPTLTLVGTAVRYR